MSIEYFAIKTDAAVSRKLCIFNIKNYKCLKWAVNYCVFGKKKYNVK